MPIKMQNLKTFPIEGLCFDLKLEVLEQLEAKDVVELAKVNQGFQSMISSRPSIVFAHHVDMIEFGLDPQGIEAINIKKSRGMRGDVIRHLPFIKNIRSCNLLWMRTYGKDYDSPIDKDHATFLKQLEAVNSLYLYWCPPQHLELLSHLSIKVKRFAALPGYLQRASKRSIKDLVGHLIETQLNECERVGVHCVDDDEFEFYYNALIKTHIKYVGIICKNAYIILPAIQRIVSHGIPSKDPRGALTVCKDYIDDMKATIVVFLKAYPGMKQIDGKNRRPLCALAKEHWSVYDALTMEALCFRRNFNATRDCIYMLYLKEVKAVSYIYFVAFYIKPDEMIDD